MSLVGTHHHNLEVHSLNASEMTNRPQNKQFWVNADGKEIYYHDVIRLGKADIDAIVARECNIPEHVLHDRVRMLASASRNEIAQSCTNHVWYATHNNYGCTYFSCGYLYYNFHWTELNWLTPNSPMNDNPSWLTCVNIQDAVHRQYRDMVFGVLKYVQVIGQQLGYRKEQWPMEEIEKIDIPGAYKIKRWVYNINFYQEFFRDLGISDHLSEYRFPMVKPRIVQADYLSPLSMTEFRQLHSNVEKALALKRHYDEFMSLREKRELLQLAFAMQMQKERE